MVIAAKVNKELHTSDFLRLLGVMDLPPRTSPFDPGYDPVTLESHLEQSCRLMSILKISMAGWLISNEYSVRRKIEAARRAGVPTVTGGGPFEIAVAQGQLEAHLDLCLNIGFTRIECGEGFTNLACVPEHVTRLTQERGLDVQFELGKKHEGAVTHNGLEDLVNKGRRWLDAGAVQLVVEARESACGVGLFDQNGIFNGNIADRLAEEFGLDVLMFEAPTKPSQFAILNHFGRAVHLCNVRLEEVLRVEIYRRGLHSDAFLVPKLTPAV